MALRRAAPTNPGAQHASSLLGSSSATHDLRRIVEGPCGALGVHKVRERRVAIGHIVGAVVRGSGLSSAGRDERGEGQGERDAT